MIAKKTAAVLIAPAMIAAAPAQRPLTSAEKAAVTHAIEVKLVDPASAQFKMGPIRPVSEYYCGLVNAKNRMGGYNGFEPFLVRYNPDRTIKIVLLAGDSAGPFGGGDAAMLRDALRQSIRQKCADNGYSTEY
jgi:hypothetical protein